MLINKHAQALVEFILILPIIIIILCIIIDFSNVYINKNHLENTLDDVIYLIRNNKENEVIIEFCKEEGISVANAWNLLKQFKLSL